MSSPYAPPEDVPLAGPTGVASIDLPLSGPPAVVLEQMAHADEISARLRDEGRRLCFAVGGDGRSLQIELRDTGGHLLRILSATEAVELAAGADL